MRKKLEDFFASVNAGLILKTSETLNTNMRIISSGANGNDMLMGFAITVST